MSRRTKLALAIALGSLGLLALIYLAWLWHPVDPLRFRPICYEEVPLNDRGEECLPVIRMAVENLSSDTIYLGEAEVREPRPGINMIADVDTRVQPTRALIAIPPHGVTHCISMALNGRDPALDRGGAPVRYRWTSASRRRMAEVMHQLRSSAPEMLLPYIPDFGFICSETRLQPPSLAPAP